ncbi:LuxR C-terminal-related transcriptional regulator [Arthrobacter sp. H20]|uniref:LuxR C-terminal-related transcriptional regulator n=1 Tax=Arthrobacter sp. H20 TaxID=1267981 RepID=UPI00047C8E32|nr:LuxR C-terminal-related transcriptional regulator [Arthrobacter sp. H20]
MDFIANPGSCDLVGRADELQIILEYIRSGSGTWIVGDAGLGKSALAEAALKELKAEVRPFRVHGSAALAGIPYGALAPLLTQLSPLESDSPIAFMRTLIGSLRAGNDPASSAPALLIVDDAHELDEASADLILQVVASREVRVLLLSRPGHAMDAKVFGPAVDRLLARYQLRPLTKNGVHELCQQVFGGRVLLSTSAAVERVSGGNPLLIFTLIAEARRGGTVVNSNGVWILREGCLLPGKHSIELTKRQLSRLSPGDREVLELVALAEPLMISALFELGRHSSIDALYEAHLIAIGEPPMPLVRPSYPLLGEILRGLVPAGRKLRLRQLLEAGASAGSLTGEALVRHTSWLLDCGVSVPNDRLLQSAAVANNLADSAFALRAASAVDQPRMASAACVQKARAYVHRGEYRSAQECLKDLSAADLDLESMNYAAHLAIRLQSPGAGDAQAIRPFSSDREVDLLQLHREVSEGKYTGVTERLRRHLDGALSDDDERSTILALTLLGEVYASTGQAARGADVTGNALRRLKDNPQRFILDHEWVLIRHVVSLIRAGRWSQIAAVLNRYTESASDSFAYWGGAIDLAMGVVQMCEGKYREASETLSGAVEGLRIHDVENLRPVALGLAAFTASVVGERVSWQRFSMEFDSIGDKGNQQSQLMGRGFILAARVVQSADPDAVAQLHSLADHAEARGWVSAEMDLRVLALGVGQHSRFARVKELASLVDGAGAALVAGFCRAVDQHDADQLVRIAHQAEDIGYVPLALLCLQEALNLAGSDQNRLREQNIRQLLEQLHQKGQSFHRGVSSPKLTRKERDIAVLVGRGKRNAEVALELGLSVRTVEGHVYRIFEKLGISRRESINEDHLRAEG